MNPEQIEALKKKQEKPAYDRDAELEDLKNRFKYVEERLTAIEKLRHQENVKAGK